MRGIASLVCLVFRNCRFELTANLGRSRKWFASPVQLALWPASPTAPGEDMGCCGSKPAEEAEDPLKGTGICEKQLHPPHISPTGLQVLRLLHSSKALLLLATRTISSRAVGTGVHSQLDCQPAIR